MTHDLRDTIALLTRTPAALDALLRGLPELWISRNEGEGTWTVTDVVGHLIHGEQTDWIPRMQRILTDGESRPFDSFDRLGHVEAIRGKTLGQLLDEFAALRAEGLRALDAIRPEDLDRRGHHPALGSVTLSQLLATWAAHDLSHLHQISRIMAAQYRGNVGPWSAYLGVMQCDGHSA